MAKSLNIDHLKMVDIMTSLSEQIKIEYTSDGEDYCIDISKELGSGYIRGMQFSHGLAVIESNVTLKKKLVLDFNKQDINCLHFLFSLDNTVAHSTSDSKKTDNVTKLQYTMFANDLVNSHQMTISKGKPTNYLIILINRKEFEEKISGIANHLSTELELIFKDVNGINYIYHKDYFSLEIAQSIEEFRRCELEEFMKPMFLEGKTYEILTNQLQNYNNSDDNSNKTLLRKSTVDKIENAIEIIQDELDVRINVHNLAKRVGLNQNTLQNGFKNLFQTSVNDYIKKYRIERAKTLIETTDLNITEITYKIGINSRSYFSKLFKERYGISPSAYISQSRGDKEKTA